MSISKHCGWILLLLSAAVSAQEPPGPALVADGSSPLSPGVTVQVPVDFSNNGHVITAIAFSLDLDLDRLGFDPADGDGDGLPDAVSFPLGAPSLSFVQFDAADSDGELDILLADLAGGLLPTGRVLEIGLLPGGGGQVADFLRFSLDPPPSFGDDRGEDVPGTAIVTAESTGACAPGLGTMCVNDRRFRLEVTWRDYAGDTGSGTVVPGVGSADSGLFYFFNANNWELLVKVVDGCGFNDHFWVLAAATTDIEFTLEVTDTETDTLMHYFNPLGSPAAAIIDAAAFATCSGGAPGPSTLIGRVDWPPAGRRLAGFDSGLQARPKQGACVPSESELCLTGDRFRIEVEWTDFKGVSGSATVVPLAPNDSGILYFFNPDNWEMLVKVIDACSFNDHFWVFAAAATNVEYTLRVTDMQTGEVKSYWNPLGNLADSITDTSAFATCP